MGSQSEDLMATTRYFVDTVFGIALLVYVLLSLSQPELILLPADIEVKNYRHILFENQII